jgi:hypothetical protein
MTTEAIVVEKYVLEQKDKRIKELEDERDELKAENERARLREADLVKRFREMNAYRDAQTAELTACLRDMVGALEKLDARLCERIIDDCGYDATKETIEDLIDLVISNSDETYRDLEYVRSTLAKHADLIGKLK